MKTDKKTIFLTGATGLVGSYLLKILLQNGHKVYALARDKNNKSANERVFEVLKFWDQDIADKYFKNCIVVNGDITQENLGLNKNINSLLKNQTEEIFHCAAITELNASWDVIKKVNIDGTDIVFSLAQGCKNLKKINHISTIYVCGDYKGIFNENSYNVGQNFTNSYSKSKFEAENIAQNFRNKGLWVDIFRLPIIVGQYKDGKILYFKNIYQLISLCKLEIFDVLPLNGIKINITPIDMAIDAINTIAFSSNMIKNMTYHPFPLHSIYIKTIIELASKIFKFKCPNFIFLEEFQIEDFSPVQKNIIKNGILPFIFDTNIDSTFTNNILKENGFIFPKFNINFLNIFLKYFKKYITKNEEKYFTVNKKSLLNTKI